MKPNFRFSILVLAFILMSWARAFAGGTVTVCDEAHLRAALVGGGAVILDCDGTITLSSELAITNNTTLDASGRSVTISGGNVVRLFTVDSGVSAALINLTLANGFNAGTNGVAGPPVTSGGPGMGGAILNNGGTVALTGCTVVSNSVMGGAGWVDNHSGDIPTSDGGPAWGGAIYSAGGSVLATNCQFLANAATGGTAGSTGGWSADGGLAAGGAIYGDGCSVVVESSTFDGNTCVGGSLGTAFDYGLAGSSEGGALWADGGPVHAYRSTFAGNVVTGADLPWTGTGAGSGRGGALLLNVSQATCESCTFSANTAVAGFMTKNGTAGLGQGGAIWNQASLSVRQCSFLGNQAIGNGNAPDSTIGDVDLGEGGGGAIYNQTQLVLSDSTFAQNHAQGGPGGFVLTSGVPGGVGKGGAIGNVGALASLAATNCTFALNVAQGGMGAGGFQIYGVGGPAAGGALFNFGATAVLDSLTLISNNAVGGTGNGGAPNGPSLGGAIFTTNAPAEVHNTILAGSTSGSNEVGALTDDGYNLSSDGSCGFSSVGSLNNTDPKTGPLDDYGGPTLTMALLASSPAIDGADAAAHPAADQRGHARPFGSAPDIGAFESSPPYTIHGSIFGNTFKDEVMVVAGASSTTTTNHGNYGLLGLNSGPWSVTPQSPDYLFLPTNRSVTVGPDQMNVDFKAYHWKALSLEEITNNVMHIIYPGTNGFTYSLMGSFDLIQWHLVTSTTMGPSNYWELFLPANTTAIQFYRGMGP